MSERAVGSNTPDGGAGDDTDPDLGAATVAANVSKGAGGAYHRGSDGRWRRSGDDTEVSGAHDLTLGSLFDPPHGDIDGSPVRLVPRSWARRRPDHPLAWAFEHADLGGRGPIPVPVGAWEARSDQVVAMAAPVLHPWNLVGIDGVAAMLGVAEATVRAYLARDQMPEPILRLGKAPVWTRDQILAWQVTRARARPPSFVDRPAPGPVEDEPDDDDREGDADPPDGG